MLPPLGAAAAIIAIAAAILATTTHPKAKANATGLTYSLSGRVPPYYLWISPGNPGNTPSDVTVRLTTTGAILGTIKPAASNGTIVAVTGAADDRTFVLDEQPFQDPTTGGSRPMSRASSTSCALRPMAGEPWLPSCRSPSRARER